MRKSHFTAAAVLTATLFTSSCDTSFAEEVDPYKQHIGEKFEHNGATIEKVASLEKGKCDKSLVRIAPDLSKIEIGRCKQAEGSVTIKGKTLTGYFEQSSWRPAIQDDITKILSALNAHHQRDPDKGYDKGAQKIIEAWDKMHGLPTKETPKNNNVSQAAPSAP